MTISVGGLERRSAASLRRFVQAQRVRVERHPERVEPSSAFDSTYWRYLINRVPLEGICAYYQTYNADGDENDWNINIAPDPAYEWMLDAGILYSLSLISGAEKPIDQVKIRKGCYVIEAELTPDNGLYGKFDPDGLPIEAGGDESENEGQGPEGKTVGVYGVFCGDYGHGGRPEIHPFDAFWRRLHAPGDDSIGWDLGVFQDDSNRFNSDWSDAPIDVEFRIPFCLDIPVSLLSAVTVTARFVLDQSAYCTTIGKNVVDRATPNLTETFTARTVRLNPSLENRLVVSIVDNTGLPGQPFEMSLDDLTYTTTAGRLGWFGQHAWLAGHLVIRVSVQQDGYAYWNVAGPNSTSAADDEIDDVIVIDPGDVVTAREMQRPVRRPRPRVDLVDVRPIVTGGENPTLAVEITADVTRDSRRSPARSVVTIRPRETGLITDPATGQTIELESFDLFATSSVEPPSGVATNRLLDISASIERLAALEGLGHHLPSRVATVEVDDVVTIDLTTRYVPFRENQTQGEERSLLSDRLNEAVTDPVDVGCDVRLTAIDGTMRRERVGGGSASKGRVVPARLETHRGRHRLVVGAFGGEPTVVFVDWTAQDRFGLRTQATSLVANYRVVDARSWVERTTGTSLADLRRRFDGLQRAARMTPTDDAVAAMGMLRALVEALESLDHETESPATRVAGAVRLALELRRQRGWLAKVVPMLEPHRPRRWKLLRG
jgi:hypothetical protein